MTIRLNHWNQRECSECTSLQSLFEYEKKQPPGDFACPPRTLHGSFRHLDRCAAVDGCIGCQVFRRALLLALTTNDAASLLTQGLAQSPIQVSLHRHSSTRWLEVQTQLSGQLVHAKTAISIANEHRVYPRVPREALQPARIERLVKWLTACHETHLCGNLAYSARNPTWLIETTSNSRLRLVSGKEVGGAEGGLVKYAAVSYCWGSEQLIKASSPSAWEIIARSATTEANLHDRRTYFSIHDLSQTLQDAITLVHSLGLWYVWIDSVCVPRGTWDDEASKMHEVYGNAYFTLSISSATKATDRILRGADAWRDENRGCRFHGPWIMNMDVSLDQMRSQSPVSSRGWVLQEERLSPRILYWSTNRAYWSCSETQRIEAKQPGGMWQEDTLASDHPQGFLQTSRRGETEALKIAWNELAAAYARRFLSPVRVVDNRFAALSGLAVRYLSSRSTHAVTDEYLAGTFRETIAQNLAWQMKEAIDGSQTLFPSVPSWSWLSVPLGTELGLPRAFEPSHNFKLTTESQVDEKDSEEEIVKRGATVKQIQVSGRLRKFVAVPDAVKVPWEGIERANPLTGFDFSLNPLQPMFSRNEQGMVLTYEPHLEEVIGQVDYLAPDALSAPKGSHGLCALSLEEGQEKNLWCFEIGAESMLLLWEVAGEPDTFQRVGVASGYRRSFFEGVAVSELRLM